MGSRVRCRKSSLDVRAGGDVSGRLCAYASTTCMIFRPDSQ
jgi:hypothetical protein